MTVAESDSDWREVGHLLEDAQLTITCRRWMPAPEDVRRYLYGIPPGFPFWYRPERLALSAGPIGRAIQAGNWQEAIFRTLLARGAAFWELADDPLDASSWQKDAFEELRGILNPSNPYLPPIEAPPCYTLSSVSALRLPALDCTHAPPPVWQYEPEAQRLRVLLDDPALQARIKDSVV